MESSKALRSTRSLSKSSLALYRRRLKMYRGISTTLKKNKNIADIKLPDHLYMEQRSSPEQPSVSSALEANTENNHSDNEFEYDYVSDGQLPTDMEIGDKAQTGRREMHEDESEGCNIEESTVIARDITNRNTVSHSGQNDPPYNAGSSRQQDESGMDANDSSDSITSEDKGTINEENMFSIDKIGEWARIPRLGKGITKMYLIASVIAISLRGKLSYFSMTLVLKNLKNIFEDSGLPSTLKGLWSMLSKNSQAVMSRHLYCRNCIFYVGEGVVPDKNCVCELCGPDRSNKPMGHFLQVKIVPQIKQLFLDPNFVKSLGYRYTRKKRTTDSMEDIYDGAKYKEKCQNGGFLSNQNNFSFSLFTDGCQVSKSSKSSAWPILLQLNELPPHARKRYILLAGIWVDKMHPDLNMLLLPTIVELQALYYDGITWTHPADGTVTTSKFVTLNCIADSVARSEILNMTRFNGMYGCTFCYDKGQQLPGRGAGRSYPVSNGATLRTDEEIRQHMELAFEKRKSQFGVKGYTSMSLLPEFDLASGVVVDSMHNVYLGVAKLHTQLLINGKASEPWYAGDPKRLSIINSRLESIRPPSRISRKPRPIQEMKQWKASEWRNWLHHYALPCLEGIIRERDLQHFSLISRASWIMNKDCISAVDLQEARLLIEDYVQKFEETFTIKNMRYNIHLLTHLVDTVQNWGPFWSHSAFPFESWNKKIVDKITSANGMPIQIVSRFLMTRFMDNFVINTDVPSQTRKQILSILTAGSKNVNSLLTLTSQYCTFRGIGNVEKLKPNDEENEALNSAGYRAQTVSFYLRAVVNGIDFRCVKGENDTKTRFCNELLYCKRYGYGKIVKLLSFQQNDENIHGILIECIGSLGLAFEAQHIEICDSSSHKRFINIEEMPLPAMIVNTLHKRYITRLPNVWETD